MMARRRRTRFAAPAGTQIVWPSTARATAALTAEYELADLP